MSNNNDSGLFQLVLMTVFRNSAQFAISNSHEIFLHNFHHRCQRRVNSMLLIVCPMEEATRISGPSE